MVDHNANAVERERIRAEHKRRSREISADLYAHWQPAEMFMRAERKRNAATMLHGEDVFPTTETKCLEIGYGTMGWLPDLISWGVPEKNLYGIELDSERAEQAKKLLPQAHLEVGDATKLPWEADAFELVVVSTVFTSALDEQMRWKIAAEMKRVLKPGGCLLWYDFAVNNPRNPNVRKVSRRELVALFPEFTKRIQSITLAPPLARLIAPKSWALATLLGALPLVRTHLLAVLIKPT